MAERMNEAGACPLEMLISALEKEPEELIRKMGLEAPAILIDQCDQNAYREFSEGGQLIRCYLLAERGVGLSRNTALMRARGEIVLFSDEDIQYDKGYAEALLGEFAAHPEADILLFNVRVGEVRRTYENKDFARVRWHNCGRYPAYAIAARTKKLRSANVCFSLLFGGGAEYSNGEDSLFLMECLRAGLRLYRTPVCIGQEEERPSTWFNGFDRKFFFDRGVLYHYLYGRLAVPLGWRWLRANSTAFLKEHSFQQAFAWLKEGVRSVC